MSEPNIHTPNLPAIPGLRLRRFAGESDYANIARVINASTAADQMPRNVTPEIIAARYARLTDSDPYADMVFAEVDGTLVGYGRVAWWDEVGTGRLYELVGYLVPEWRRKRIGSAILRWQEERSRELAASAPPGSAPFHFHVSIEQPQVSTAALLEKAGYRPARYFFAMDRTDLENIPDYPLPAGLEIRPARPEHYPAIWQSIDETSQDEWGYTAPTPERYQRWLSSPHFQPDLWQIAWDPATERVVGHVLTFIDHEENAALNRKRGYTEGIGVDRAWRRRGLARALICRSLRAQKAAGMTESTLAADGDSEHQVAGLYESCGFQVVQRDTMYRKPF